MNFLTWLESLIYKDLAGVRHRRLVARSGLLPLVSPWKDSAWVVCAPFQFCKIAPHWLYSASETPKKVPYELRIAPILRNKRNRVVSQIYFVLLLTLLLKKTM